MPFLAGGNMVDASGNRIVDGSANPVMEAGIPVVVSAGNFLMSGLGGVSIGGLYQTIVDALTGVLIDRLMNGEPTATLDLPASLNAIRGATDYWTPNVGSSWQRQVDIRADVASILSNFPITFPPDTGGLTTEEHDQLMALLNLDPVDLANAVWQYTVSDPTSWGYNNNLGTGAVLEYVKRWLDFQAGYVGIPVPDRQYFNLCYPNVWEGTVWMGFWTNEAETTAVPELDLSLVESGDTVWSYLQREYPGFTWLRTGPGSWPIGNRIRVEIPEQAAYYVCTLTDSDIRNWWPPTSDPPPVVNVSAPLPPVWPGADNVTLGETVALTPNLHLVGPMDGVIVSITTPPNRSGLYEVGGAMLDYGQGRVTFETDNGDLEPWQYTGFRTAIYTPRTMVHAAGVRFQVLAGAGGTVTPWVMSA